MFDLETIGRLVGLIPALTLLAFVAGVAIVAFGRDGRWAARITVLTTGLSTLIALALLMAANRVGGHHLSGSPLLAYVPWAPTGTTSVDFGWLIDPLSVATAAMVAVVCLMIFIFSTAYMAGEFTAYRDPLTGEVDRGLGNARYGRFFAFAALFATGMLGFVLAANLLEALIFWEIMGLCSFLLIGFWYGKPSAAAAAVKAFLTTRVGDVFFLLGVFLLYGYFGTVDYPALLSPAAVARLRELGAVPGTGVPVASVIALLIFGGAIGKSAQIPLHVWLPDAMEGPTPVSALIHAATMVAAGVFLIARMYPLFTAQSLSSPDRISGPMFVVAAIGSLTAIFAASIGIAQFDIKRVLAYSTVSQLGYMVMALGIGAYVAAVFHLITHAFFKSLLFLGSGSVIHGVEHGWEHSEAHGELAGHGNGMGDYQPVHGWAIDEKDPAQDMRNMGGLRERMPFTFVTFLIGAFALTGIPLFAGFWSKDEILAEAFHKGLQGHLAMAAIVWLLGTVAAFLTAFYMARQVLLVFAGKPRTEAAQHGQESGPAMVYPLIFLALASFAAVLGMPESFPVFGHVVGNPVHRFLGAIPFGGPELPALAFNAWPAIVTVALAVLGWILGWLVYGRAPERAREREPLLALGPLWTLLNRKYFVDELYGATIIPAIKWLGDACGAVDSRGVDGLVNAAGVVGRALSTVDGWFDQVVVDGLVNLTATVNVELSRALRHLQSGRVQQYLLIVFVGVLLLIGVFAR
jgi:NADH-quinone oxidoreductase subunit L